MKDKKIKRALNYTIETSIVFTETYGTKIGRSLNITGAAAAASIFLVLGKLIMGIMSLSLFACVNAFYSLGMIGAKSIALIGIRRTRDGKEQHQYYFLSGVILIVSSILFMIYSIRLFYSPIRSYYHMYVAIGIAAVTFTEIALNIRGVIRMRHNHTLLIHAIKMTNLSNSLIALVLTQTAILSFTNRSTDLVDITKWNGVIGILMSTITAVIGIYMIYRARRIKDTIY